MEAAILLGLVGIGYLKNKEQKTPIDSTVIEDISKVNTGNVYDSTNYYKETNEQVKELAKEKFSDSFHPDKNVFNSKKVPKRETLITDLKENFTDSVYSSISDNYIDQNDFLRNDQGISAQPFFKKAPAELDLSDTRQLDRHQGDNRLKESKEKQLHSFNGKRIIMYLVINLVNILEINQDTMKVLIKIMNYHLNNKEFHILIQRVTLIGRLNKLLPIRQILMF